MVATYLWFSEPRIELIYYIPDYFHIKNYTINSHKQKSPLVKGIINCQRISKPDLTKTNWEILDYLDYWGYDFLTLTKPFKF